MRLLILPLALLLASCAADRPPPDWSRMPKTAGCASIAGVYDDHGAGDPQFAQNYRSGSMLPGDSNLSNYVLDRADFDKGFQGADTVEIAASGSGWTFRFLRGGKLFLTKEFAGPLRCRGGWLLLSESSDSMKGPIVGHGSDAILLRRASDGSLVVEDVQRVAALFMVWPVVGGEERYMRFAPR